MVTLGKLMQKAIAFFEENARIRKRISGVLPEIRNVLAQEMSIGKERATATFHIEYAINGDYTESDANPVYVSVEARDKQIKAWNPYAVED